jgi:hypothetical protein
MFDQVELDGEFFAGLARADAEIAEVVRGSGCRLCGGRLHRGDYLRKPRGALLATAGEAFAVRFSFCCGREGCRRRTTPPSLRFLGRRVYLEAVVLVASVIAATRGCGRDTGRVVGVGPRTLGRWVAWWRGSFLETLVFVTLAGALAMGTSRARGCMPVSLWAASPVAEGAETVRWLARALAPLTTTSFGSPIVRGIP